VAIDWILDLIFSKDLVQLPTLRAPTVSGPADHAPDTQTKAATDPARPANMKTAH